MRAAFISPSIIADTYQMPEPEIPGYGLGTVSLAVLVIAVLFVAVGVIVKIAAGSAALIVVGFVAAAIGVVCSWTSLVLLMKWAKDAARSDGGTTYDHLMVVRRRLDSDVRQMIHRVSAKRS
jgi:hypothetical protein